MANSNLHGAKRSKSDEFYTQYDDIQKEIEAYLEHNPDTFRNKVVYCNCDDPYESNFFRFFVKNFRRLGITRLITTSYKPSPIANSQLPLLASNDHPPPPPAESGSPKVTANKFIIEDVHHIDQGRGFNLEDVAQQLRANANNEWVPLEGDGDFRSDECVELLKQADIVVTNPPFSLFREYIQQLVEYDNKYLIIGNMNAVTYKGVFPLIRDNKTWFGPSITSGDRWFGVPADYPLEAATSKQDTEGNKFIKVKGVRWFTNLEHGRRHQPLPLMTMIDNLKYNNKLRKELQKKVGSADEYPTYDNYDAIEVPITSAIPEDCSGAMGVPISFLDKYCPEQFEILDANDFRRSEAVSSKPHGLIKDGSGAINGKPTYVRILIRHKQQ